MQNDRIVSLLPLTLCEKQLNPQHADITVIKNSVIWLVSPTFWRRPQKLVYSDQMFFLSLHMLKNSEINPLKIAIHEAIVLTIVTYSWMPTNLRQQKGWEFGETPYKRVATSVYKFGTKTVQIYLYRELRGLNLPVHAVVQTGLQ